MLREVYREYRPDRLSRVHFVVANRVLGVFVAEAWEGHYQYHSKASLRLYPVPDASWVDTPAAFWKALPVYPSQRTLRLKVDFAYWPDEEKWREVARRLASALVAIDHPVPVPA